MLWLVDLSHVVYPDIRGHTGGVITFVTGMILSPKSSKQKMNSWSSNNETEVIGTNIEYLSTKIGIIISWQIKDIH